MPRKIKVSDITPENNEKDPVNVEVEVVKELEPIVEEEDKQEEKVEETQEKQEEEVDETPQETPTEIVEEVTKTRKQELKQCPKCKKWLTAKTLFYFHQCTKNDVPKAKRRPKKVIVQDIEDIEDYAVVKTTTQTTSGYVEPKTPRMPKQIDYTPKIEISYEDMRRERIKQRIEQRSVKIKNLFSSAI